LNVLEKYCNSLIAVFKAAFEISYKQIDYKNKLNNILN